LFTQAFHADIDIGEFALNNLILRVEAKLSLI